MNFDYLLTLGADEEHHNLITCKTTMKVKRRKLGIAKAESCQNVGRSEVFGGFYLNQVRLVESTSR
jgi:ribosomal protein L37AE/L43A